jgi:hypothetical protein
MTDKHGFSNVRKLRINHTVSSIKEHRMPFWSKDKVFKENPDKKILVNSGINAKANAQSHNANLLVYSLAPAHVIIWISYISFISHAAK